MRRLAASFALGLALICASVAWSAYSTRSTILDAKRSDRIADALISDPLVREAAAKGLSDALFRALPTGVPIPRSEVETAARRALDDPRALGALKAAIVGSHQRLVGEASGPVTLDARPIAEAGRDALIAARPELAASLPALPDMSLDLPTDNLPDLGKVKGPMGAAAQLGGLLALGLVGIAFAVAKDRPRVLSRLGRWGVAAGLGWAAIGYVVPLVVSRLGNPRLAVLGSLGKAVSGPLVAPAAGLFIMGVGAVLAARLWRMTMTLPPGGAAPSSYPAPPLRPKPEPGQGARGYHSDGSARRPRPGPPPRTWTA